MKAIRNLHISIPKPCDENWDDMERSNKGKLCNKCSNLVFDFSGLSDNEMLGIFLNSKLKVHCGRFHNTQLNREILFTPIKKRSPLYKFNKIAAALFTILSGFKSFALQASPKSQKNKIIYNSNFKYQKNNGKVIISGIIIDEDGKPLENATITFDTILLGTSDKDGRFSFEIDFVSASSHNLYFNYNDLLTVVRTYHPAMLSTNYDITLYKKNSLQTYHTMGVPAPFITEWPSLEFKSKEIKISVANKALLSNIASKLMNNPTVVIKLKGYINGNVSQSIISQRLQNIKNYFILKEGISPDRINTVNDVTTKENKNFIDIETVY